MDRATHLLPEDLPDFERVLDEALRLARHHGRPGTGADRFDAEALREAARDAVGEIAPRAEAEYRRYTRLRERLRHPGDPAGAAGAPGARRGADERTGAGLAAVVSVLVPVLAGVAAVIFLLVGYALRLAEPEPALAGAMRAVGWVFAVLMVLGLVVGGTELLIGALRNGATQIRDGGSAAAEPGALSDEVDRARQAWRRALLEEGLTPYLRQALAERAPGGPPQPGHAGPRTPRLSYSSPDYTSPADGSGAAAAGDGGRGYGHPRFGHPSFSSPDFTSPAEHAEGSDVAEGP